MTGAGQEDGGGSGSRRISDLYLRVRAALDKTMSKKKQKELARLLAYLPELSFQSNEHLIPFAELATESLISDQPNQVLIEQMRRKLDFWLGKGALRTFRRAESRASLVILGLSIVAYFIFFFLYLVLEIVAIIGIHRHFQISSQTTTVLCTAAAGFWGSITGILHRLGDTHKEADEAFIVLNTMARPLVGIAFALFIYFALDSKLFGIAVNTANPRSLFITLGFVAGFSERFASGVLSRTERSFASHD